MHSGNLWELTGNAGTKLAGLALALLLAAVGSLAGCGTGAPQKQNQSFFTSGSNEADQRASQRMAKSEQLVGSGDQSSGKTKTGKPGSQTPVQAQQKRTLYDRLGGEKGLTAIVNDFTPRVIEDPRVNWTRKGVKSSGLFHHKPSVTWDPTAANVATLKTHLVQFLALV